MLQRSFSITVTSLYSAGKPKVSLESFGIQLESFVFRWNSNGICPKQAETAFQRLFDRKTGFPLEWLYSSDDSNY